MPAGEPSSANSGSVLVAADKGKHAKTVSGAKAVRPQDLPDNAGPTLNETQATTFRASVAMANRLAHGKANATFAETGSA